MTALSKSLAGAVIGAGILAFSAVSASAGIACVGLVCWHVQEHLRISIRVPRGRS